MDNPIFIIVAVFIVAVLVGGFLLRRKRAKQAQELVAARGWRYEKSDLGVLDAYPQLFPLNGGTGLGVGALTGGRSSTRTNERQARDVVYLTAGDYPGHSFTCRYVTEERGSDNQTSRQTHNWHVVGLELPVPFPNVTIRRRRRLDAIENKLTKPVEFPMPEFTAAYTVHSEHPPAALDLITPDTVQWLLSQEVKNEIVLEDNHIYIYAKGQQKVDNIDPMLALLTGFLDRIPPAAWQKAQGEYPRPQRMRFGEVDVGQIVNVVKGLRKPQE